MPICYDIEIEVMKDEGAGPEPVRPLPLRIPDLPGPLTNDELRSRVRQHFNDFLELILGYDRPGADRYSSSYEYVVTAVFNC